MAQPELFRVTRPWALGSAVVLLTYAAVGGTAGVLWLIALVQQLVTGPPPGRPFITAWSVNLLFAPIALVGGVLAISLLLRRGRRRLAARLRRPGAGVDRLEAPPALGGRGGERPDRVPRVYVRRRRADGRVSR